MIYLVKVIGERVEGTVEAMVVRARSADDARGLARARLGAGLPIDCFRLEEWSSGVDTPRPREPGTAMSCTCGCAREEHGHDPDYPGSTACTNCEDCIAFEEDPLEDDESCLAMD
jgi:hypothetical protein